MRGRDSRGATVTSMNLGQWSAVILLALLSAGCGVEVPAAPTPIDRPQPIALALTASPQIVTAPATVAITVAATRNGASVANVDVAWRTTSGQLQNVSTRTDVNGHATAVLVTTATAVVSVDAGGSATEVAINVTAPQPTPPPSIPGPVPTPAPSPSPTPDPTRLFATVSCTPAASGASADCVATANRGTTPLTSEIAGATWIWGDGSSTYANMAAAHQWAVGGSFPVSIEVFLTDGTQLNAFTYVTVKR